MCPNHKRIKKKCKVVKYVLIKENSCDIFLLVYTKGDVLYGLVDN